MGGDRDGRREKNARAEFYLIRRLKNSQFNGVAPSRFVVRKHASDMLTGMLGMR